MTTVREIMSPDPYVVPASTCLDVTARLMRDVGIGDVLVERDKTICGLVTDRDIVVRAITDGSDPATVPVGDICTRDVHSVRSTDSPDRAVETMRTHGIRRLPVIDDGVVVGVVSLGDLAIERDGSSALAEISAAPPNT